MFPTIYKSHSFRTGDACWAATKDIPDTDIQSICRWRSLAIKCYIRLPIVHGVGMKAGLEDIATKSVRLYILVVESNKMFM